MQKSRFLKFWRDVDGVKGGEPNTPKPDENQDQIPEPQKDEPFMSFKGKEELTNYLKDYESTVKERLKNEIMAELKDKKDDDQKDQKDDDYISFKTKSQFEEAINSVVDLKLNKKMEETSKKQYVDSIKNNDKFYKTIQTVKPGWEDLPIDKLKDYVEVIEKTTGTKIDSTPIPQKINRPPAAKQNPTLNLQDRMFAALSDDKSKKGGF